MQLSLLNQPQGSVLADEGLTKAVDKADRDHPEWSERCWQLFLRWLSKKQPGHHFLIEDFRNDCMKWEMIEEPNSNRAFGFISKRAVNQKLIVSAGKAKTKSSRGHGANAEVWSKI